MDKPNNYCADDVVGYNLYYTDVEGGTPQLIATFSSENDTTYLHSNDGSIAGCYWITALDSAIYGNESDFSNMMCIDNCPHYTLPNVFSPNGEGTMIGSYPFRTSILMLLIYKYSIAGVSCCSKPTDPDIFWMELRWNRERMCRKGCITTLALFTLLHCKVLNLLSFPDSCIFSAAILTLGNKPKTSRLTNKYVGR